MRNSLTKKEVDFKVKVLRIIRTIIERHPDTKIFTYGLIDCEAEKMGELPYQFRKNYTIYRNDAMIRRSWRRATTEAFKEMKFKNIDTESRRFKYGKIWVRDNERRSHSKGDGGNTLL